jgi:hypothetical protein
MLLNAVRDLTEGKEPPHIVRDPRQNDFSRLRSLKGVLPADADWRQIMAGLGPNDG